MQPFGTLLIANNFGIVGGRDTEDDESYRYRISLKLKSQSGINEAALRFAILQVPGIQDIVFAPFAAGFYAYVYGISPVVPISLIQAVNDQISQYAAYPINLASSAITPDLVGISLATTLSFKAGTTQAEKDVVSLSAASAAQTYIDNLGVGQPLIINNISNQIRQSDARISDSETPTGPFCKSSSGAHARTARGSAVTDLRQSGVSLQFRQSGLSQLLISKAGPPGKRARAGSFQQTTPR